MLALCPEVCFLRFNLFIHNFKFKLWASPHIPQVVYPSKERTRTGSSDGISKGKATSKFLLSVGESKNVQRELLVLWS